MRFRPDPTLRSLAPTIRLGGSPLRLWRLSETGAALVDRLGSGADVEVASGSAVESLVDRLVDAGVLHPDPAASSAAQEGSSCTALAASPHLGAADVTVVIPVKDRLNSLGRLLTSLGSTIAAGATVIVVDDGSADAAAHERVTAAHGATYVRRDRVGGPAAARNEGLARVATPLVAFLDSDCTIADASPGTPADTSTGMSTGTSTGTAWGSLDCEGSSDPAPDPPHWLSAPLALLHDAGIAVVAPRVRTPAGTPSVGRDSSSARPSARLPPRVARYESFRSPLDMGAEPARVAPGTRVSYVPAAALLARVEVLRGVGGFDATLRVGEDVDLIWRLVDAGYTVRYEPTSIVEHPARADLRRWLRQRIDYGSSAALLDARHPMEVAPVHCSPWSALGWGLLALGPAPLGPVAGVAVMAGSAAALPHRLDGVPARVSLQLAATGHLGAGRQLARAVVRAWWPLAVPAALVWRPARRAVIASVVVVAADAALDARRSDARRSDARRAEAGAQGGATRQLGLGDLAAISFLAVLDDLAYGAGVWLGCWRQRSFRSLRARFARSTHRL